VTDTTPQPHIKARKTTDMYFSPIWILPVLALIITIWLVVKLVMDSKIPITIDMPTAEGIVIGKTELKFRGLKSGLVTDIFVSDDLSHVTVQLEVNPDIARFLTTSTQFWVVRPQISLAGVSGLETVLSGDYIAIEPGGEGDAARHFVALKAAPPLGEDDPGLHITLQADNLGSISEGSQLYYRQIPIGEVRFFQLSDDSKSVRINAVIEEQYDELVNQSTVFWNSGGIKMKGSLSGFEIQTESLSSVLAGGISLFTPDADGHPIAETTVFDLYEDYDAAGVGVPVEIRFSSGYDLKSGITKVIYHGIKVGHLDSIHVSSGDDIGIIATVIIDPGAEALLNSNTEFWLVKPNLSLSNLSNLDTLISGNYITMKVGDAEEQGRAFVALNGPPPPDFSEPGLHLYLKTDSMGSLSIGTPILFKGVEVGRVEDILKDDLTKGIGLHLQIRPEYSQLINSSSRFWNVSGVDISAGLGGVKVQSESVMTIIRGGIAFETPNDAAARVEDGHEFYLLDSQDGSENKLTVLLRMPNAEFVEAGVTRLRYKGFDAGILKKIHYDSTNNEVIAELGVDPRFKEILKASSIFWLVRPQLKASEVKGLDALLSGAYFTVQSGDGEEQFEFELANSAPALDWSTEGLHLKLTAKSAASLQPGSGIYYQDILVGTVQAVELNKSTPGVSIQIHIQQQYADRVQTHSRFFNVSGVAIKASSSGISINTGSIDSLLSGGIAFVTDNKISSTMAIENGESFQLFNSKDEAEQQGFSIVLDLKDTTAINKGAKITYKGIKVGEVRKSRLNLEQQSVEITASIQNEMRELVREGTRFWLAKTQFGLLRQKNLGNLLSGPQLKLIPGDGEMQNRFSVLNQAPVIKTKPTGLNLILESSVLGSVATGVPVYYRQIKVGEVLGYDLSANADSVLIYINIDQRYQVLVRENSQFWNTSGVAIEAGLFSGVEIKSESLESLIAGGIAFATPDDAGETVTEQYHFTLNNSVEDDWKEWSPQIPLQ